MIKAEYISASGAALFASSHETEVRLAFEAEYEPGCAVVLTCMPGAHLYIQTDASILPGEVYVPGGVMTWRVPFGSERDAYPPAAFAGARHTVTARAMTADEIYARRNLARNPADLRGETDFFPHASANVETRGEALFAARNVIDGCLFNSGHWGWPYQSWGIGGRDDACCTLDLGRCVEIDEMALTLRADFPHDDCWCAGRVVFDGADSLDFRLKKTAERQFIAIGPRRLRQIRLEGLRLPPDASGFPALTEWEVFGRDIR